MNSTYYRSSKRTLKAFRLTGGEIIAFTNVSIYRRISKDCSVENLLFKLLLDEMYAGLKEYFETLGWEVLTIQEVGLQGVKDKEVVQYAKKNNLLLVTQDQKPAELADLTGVKFVLISNALIAKIADAKIREKYAN